MKKTFTEEAFQKAVKSLNMGSRAAEMAREVLVCGKTQTNVAAQYQVTKGAVCKHVGKVRDELEQKVPPGFQKVTAILTDHQAFLVRKWATDIERRREAQK